MTPPPAQLRFAEALRALQALQRRGHAVYRSEDLSGPHRRVLADRGYIRPIIRGWYMPSRPDEHPGDTTPWFASMRAFVAAYCEHRFGKKWYVSPSLSVQSHAGSTLMPRQMIVHTPGGTNNVRELPNGCSLMDYKAPDFAAGQSEILDGLRVLRLPVALVRVPEAFFQAQSTDAQIALSLLPDVSDLNRELLEGGHSAKAGVLAGALRITGRADLAEDILGTMRTAGYTVVESNPFQERPVTIERTRAVSPYVLRLQLMWRSMRPHVVDAFGTPRGLPADIDTYLRHVDEIYRTDAYHSLSIEGYRVSDALIERVASGTWDPRGHDADSKDRDALAARGYFQAFQRVKASLADILAGENAGEVASRDHGAWYRELFGASVQAGLLRPADLAGYRNGPVYIANAKHVPPSRDAVRDMMPAFFDLLREETHPAVRAVLGHFAFVFIHPYSDGNGRMGRFLMNAMLASGGYDWTVIRVERRAEYMAALNSASSDGDIGPFARFIASAVSESEGATEHE